MIVSALPSQSELTTCTLSARGFSGGPYGEKIDIRFLPDKTTEKSVPAQAVDATLACSLLAGVWKPKVFLGR
jgi:hypothetical protein